jgi:bilirubin oxidase
LGEPTTIHWHGLHVSPENDGGPHIIIQPGSTWSPSFEVLDWASTHWYHPHLHHHTNEHVLKGIAGFIISRDSNESSLNLPRTYGVDDFPLVVQTKAFNANNQIEIHSALDTALMVNATLKPYLDLPAQVVRLRLLNGSSERYYNFGFSGNRSFQVIASDAGLLTSPVQMTRLLMAPGERTEILVDLNGLTGQTLYLMNYGAEIPNGIYGASQPGMGQGQSIPNYNQNPLNGSNFNILQINVVPQTTNPITSIPSQLSTHNPWAESLASRTRTFTFNTVNQGPTAINGPFRINGALFDMAVINFNVEFEDVEIWQITNQTPIGHPFHLHGFPFYVLSINGQMPPAHLRGRKDVIHVPAGQGVVRFITKFENFYHDSLP